MVECCLLVETADRTAHDGSPDFTVHEIDGVRVETDDGWWLLRASNTQAVLVARCESAQADGLERLKQALCEQLELSGIDPPVL